NMLCRGVERARSAVIAQAAPRCQHGLLSRSRQLLCSWELLQKRFVPLLHHSYARLLQHDFGNQDTVWIGFSSPRQFALLTIEPVQQPLAKIADLLRGEFDGRRHEWRLPL